jgi:uncharacterized Tic20 family protein
MDSAMLLLLIVLVGVVTYLLFSPTSLLGPMLDKYCKREKESWTGEDVGESLIKSVNEEAPPTPKTKKKRKYKKRSKKK